MTDEKKIEIVEENTKISNEETEILDLGVEAPEDEIKEEE